jgi:hypothetical protein
MQDYNSAVTSAETCLKLDKGEKEDAVASRSNTLRTLPRVLCLMVDLIKHIENMFHYLREQVNNGIL